MKHLIVVDMQNDFVDGALGSKEAEAIVPNVIKLIDSEDYDNIIYTKDTHYNNYMDTLEGEKLPVPHCIYDTPGWDIIDAIRTNKHYDGTKTIIKNTFGSDTLFSKFAFENEIEPLEFEICGLCTDICVISNALMLRAACPNSKITVRANCCAGVTPEKHEAALQVMESCQIDVIR